jgi:hypothetical protein
MSVTRLFMSEIRKLAGRGGPGGKAVRQHAQATAMAARGRVARRTGAEAGGIRTVEGEDSRGYFVDVATTVRNPRTGFPYGIRNELRRRVIRQSVR